VRNDPRRFAVVPGHEIAEVEDVVERHEHYAVIEKARRKRPTSPSARRRVGRSPTSVAGDEHRRA